MFTLGISPSHAGCPCADESSSGFLKPFFCTLSRFHTEHLLHFYHVSIFLALLNVGLFYEMCIHYCLVLRAKMNFGASREPTEVLDPS